MNQKAKPDIGLLGKVSRGNWLRTAAVMIREPEKKKEQEKRRPGYRLSPWS